MRYLLLASLLVGCSDGSGSADSDGDTTPDPRLDRAGWPATVGGDRPARVVAPSTASAWDGASALPVVVLLHGFGANSTVQDLLFGLSGRVDALGFILVLPEGTRNADNAQFWNATPACCDFENTGVDDVAYLGGLIDEIELTMPVDADRVGFVGHSNGGFMSHRMACERSDRVSAIVSLAGSTWLDEADCGEGGPVHVLQIHGDGDDTILFGGDVGYPSAPDTVGRWADRAGCDGETEESGPFDYDTLVDGEETYGTRYTTGCAKEAELWRIAGAGHVPYLNGPSRDAIAGWVLEKSR